MNESEYYDRVLTAIEERDDFDRFIEIVQRRNKDEFMNQVIAAMTHLGFRVGATPDEIAEMIVISFFEAEESCRRNRV